MTKIYVPDLKPLVPPKSRMYMPDLKPLVPPKSRMYIPISDYSEERSDGGTVVDMLGSSLDEITVYGKSVQDGTPTPSEPVPIRVVDGNNLLPQEYISTVTREVVVTVNADKSVTLDGTVTGGNMYYTIYGSTNTQLPSWLKAGGVYYKDGYNAYFYDSNKTQIASFGPNVSMFIVPNSAVYVWFAFYAANNSVIDDLTVYPMLSEVNFEDKNLFGVPMEGFLRGTNTTYMKIDLTGGGTVFVVQVEPNTDYAVSAKMYTGMNRFRLCLFNADPRDGSEFAVGDFSQAILVNNPSSDQLFRTFNSGSFTWAALGLSTGDTAYNENAKAYLELETKTIPYTPHGSIGLLMGDVLVPIDLDGNVLASLPDGTRDELTVDSAGHVVLTKRIETVTFGGDSTWTYSSNGPRFYKTLTSASKRCDITHASAITNLLELLPSGGSTSMEGFNISQTSAIYVNVSSSYPDVDTVEEFQAVLRATPLTVVYPLATPQTIDLGTIELPEIPEGGCEVSIVATVVPYINIDYTVSGEDLLARLLDVPE